MTFVFRHPVSHIFPQWFSHVCWHPLRHSFYEISFDICFVIPMDTPSDNCFGIASGGVSVLRMSARAQIFLAPQGVKSVRDGSAARRLGPCVEMAVALVDVEVQSANRKKVSEPGLKSRDLHLAGGELSKTMGGLAILAQPRTLHQPDTGMVREVKHIHTRCKKPWSAWGWWVPPDTRVSIWLAHLGARQSCLRDREAETGQVRKIHPILEWIGWSCVFSLLLSC